MLGQADWPATEAVLVSIVFGSFNIPADIIASGWWLDKEHSLLGAIVPFPFGCLTEGDKAEDISIFAAPAPCCCGGRSRLVIDGRVAFRL